MTHRRSSSSKGSRKGHRKSKTEKKHNKWFQRGCQNKSARKGGQKGGSGIFGGNAWAPSNIHPVSGAEGPAAAPAAPAAPVAAAGHSQKGGNSGNHYVFNPNPIPPPQASNALVEFANKMSGGRGRGSGGRRHKQRGNRKSRRGIKLACSRSRRSSSRRSSSRSRQQRGGATEYLPMTASNIVRSIGDDVGSFIHGLQGAPTAYNYSDPTMQPIGNTSQLQ
jgi:hypothetical protein